MFISEYIYALEPTSVCVANDAETNDIIIWIEIRYMSHCAATYLENRTTDTTWKDMQLDNITCPLLCGVVAYTLW